MTPPESLTETERTWLLIVRDPLSVTEQSIIRKLLRIHDRLEAEVREMKIGKATLLGRAKDAEARVQELGEKLDHQQAEVTKAVEIALDAGNRSAELEQRLEDEQEQTRAHVQAQMLAEARVRELETYCKAQAEANETLAQCLRERDAAAEDAKYHRDEHSD